jgi:hypothetical protein
MCFRQIQSGADSDRMRIRKRIYKMADSERTRSENKNNRIGNV